VRYTFGVKPTRHILFYTKCMKNLGERIAHVIKSYPGNQTELGNEVGVSRGAVSQWKVGEAKAIKAENLFPLARATGYSPEWIATGKGPKHILNMVDEEEINLIESYRKIPKNSRATIKAVIEVALSGLLEADDLDEVGIDKKSA